MTGDGKGKTVQIQLGRGSLLGDAKQVPAIGAALELSTAPPPKKKLQWSTFLIRTK